ncbi:hypothetical protein Prudu_001163, partial [Prunus dulcis]
ALGKVHPQLTSVVDEEEAVGPDPNSALEFELDPVRVRHLANVGHKRPIYPSGCNQISKFALNIKSTRAANWQDSGDRSQPDPQSWLSRSGRPRKLMRQMSSALTKLKENWMSVDIVIPEGNRYWKQTVSVLGTTVV